MNITTEDIVDSSNITAQVCIIGAGAGGIGCAFRLVKKGISVVIVDKNADYGGTMTFGGVDGWEPGVSLDGINTIIAEELLRMPNAAHIVENVPTIRLVEPNNTTDNCFNPSKERPWGYVAPCGGCYEDTLARCSSVLNERTPKRFQFDGDLFAGAIRNILKPYKNNITELFGYEYVSCEKLSDKITSVSIKRNDNKIKIHADFFVDASGDIVLARDAGCAYTFGKEGKADYNEPSATERSSTINAVSYVFRVARADSPKHVDNIPEKMKIDLGEWAKVSMKRIVSYIVQYPNGDLSINMLPTMEGEEYFSLGDRADFIGKARVYAYWHYLQTERGLAGYTIKRIFDAGIRESYRLIGKYVLREQDLRAGSSGESKIGKTVAIADHTMDVHGSGGFSAFLDSPYEIPIQCAETNEFDNLFVCCRGASFTHLAASSARLSRTMLSMGEGVGEHIALLLS